MKRKDKNTEQVILQTARKIFIQKGLAGARMQDIADQAGFNKALVILATMLASCAGGDYENLTKEQLTFVEVNQEKLDQVDSCINQLQVDVEKLKRIK